MNEYKPIACATHDRIEAAATLRTRVRVTWRDGGSIAEREGVVEDVSVRDGAEYLVIDGAQVRLDWIEVFETL